MPAFLPLCTTFSHIIQLFYIKKQVDLSDLLLPLMSYFYDKTTAIHVS